MHKGSLSLLALLAVLEHDAVTALAAVVAVVVHGHEDSSTAALTLLSEASDGVVLADGVVPEDGELHLLVNVLYALGGGVLLLLALLATTAKAEHQVERGLLLDVVVSQGAAILELLAGEDEALLIRGDALLVLDLLLHRGDGVA